VDVQGGAKDEPDCDARAAPVCEPKGEAVFPEERTMRRFAILAFVVVAASAARPGLDDVDPGLRTQDSRLRRSSAQAEERRSGSGIPRPELVR
jgi:hypothetical protein